MNSSTLEFQSFDLDSPERSPSTHVNFNSPIDQSYKGLDDRTGLDDQEPVRSSSKSFWTFEFYQQFFDVNTDEVTTRIMWAIFPRPRKNYLEHCLKPNPDLYGPFWICTTLIFTIAVIGNVANYLHHQPTESYHWKYDFHLISWAATAIFSYACLVPTALYTFMKWNSTLVNVSFLELICAYGYSLSVFVPVSLLSVIPISGLQHFLIVIGSILSAFTLVTTVWCSVEGPKRIPSVVIVVVLHSLLSWFLFASFKIPAAAPSTLSTLAPALNVSEVVNSFHKPEASS